MPAKALPRNPDLRHLSRQAKRLLDAHRDGKDNAARRLQAGLPRCGKSGTAAILAAPLTLQEAQHVVATEYGFKNWTNLAEYVEARALHRGDHFSQRVWDGMDSCIEAALARTDNETLQSRRVVFVPMDDEFEIEEPGLRSVIKMKGLTRVPFWDTPQERHDGPEIDQSFHTDARLHHKGDRPEPPKELWEWTNHVSTEPIKAATAAFAERAGAVLTRLSGNETEIGHHSFGWTEHDDFIQSADEPPALFYRFAVAPAPGHAALSLPISLACALLDLPYEKGDPHGRVTDSDRPRLEKILHAVLEEFSAAWQGQNLRCHALERCAGSNDLGIAPFAERIGLCRFLLQSERASRFLELCFPKAVLEVLLPPATE